MELVKIYKGVKSLNGEGEYEIEQMDAFEFTDIRELVKYLKNEGLRHMHFDGISEFYTDPGMEGDVYFMDIVTESFRRSMTLAHKYSQY